MLKRVLVAAAATAVVLGGIAAPASAQVVRICHEGGSTCDVCVKNGYVDACVL